MRSRITYGILINKLKSIDFVEKKIQESHIVLFNNKFNSTIVLPSFKKNKQIENYILMTVKKNLVGKGVLNSEEFEELIRNK